MPKSPRSLKTYGRTQTGNRSGSEGWTKRRLADEISRLPTTRRLLLLLAHADASSLPRRLRKKATFNMWPSQYIDELEREFRDRATAKLLCKLKEYRFIETRRTGHRMRYLLTDKGASAAMHAHIKLAPVLKDGRLLIVSFDVPECQRPARDALRRFLHHGGFTRWHDSLWVTDKDIRPPIEAALKRVRGGKWVTIYETRVVREGRGNS